MREAQIKVAAVVLFMAVATYAVTGAWLTKALKVGNAALYVVILYGVIWVFLAYLTLRRHKPNIALSLFTSALLGHIAAALASLVLHLTQPDGVQRFFNSVHQFGVIDFALAYLASSLLLGGWLLAPATFFITFVVVFSGDLDLDKDV